MRIVEALRARRSELVLAAVFLLLICERDFAGLAVFLIVLVILLVGAVYFTMRKMSEPEKMLRWTGAQLNANEQSTVSKYSQWLASQGLQFRNSYQFGRLRGVVFQQENQPRFFTFLFQPRLTFSAESYLDDLTILDTSTSGTLGMVPRPGAYAQSFPNLPAQEAWQRHLEGESQLAQRFGFHWLPLSKPYEEILPEALRVRIRYNRSQSFWPFRVLYRYFVTRHRVNNRSIAQQFP